MSYPTSIDSIPQPSPTSPTNAPSASGVSTAQTNAIIALETKVGTGASTPTAGDVLTSTSNGTSVWAATGTGNVSNTGTPTSGQIAQWTGATVIQGLATTGSGNVVLATSPTLVTPALGTPSAIVLTNATGTASNLTAGNVTTNANLTGPIISSGNATSIASQTGTGSKFVVDTSPTLVTPNLGTPSATVLTNATGLPYAGLLSTIFSGQVQSQTNAGTAGGTIYYINLGGIKLAWGNTGAVETAANLGTSATYTITLPTSFFSTLQACILTPHASYLAEGFVQIVSQTTTTITFFANQTASVTDATVNGEFLVLGT